MNELAMGLEAKEKEGGIFEEIKGGTLRMMGKAKDLLNMDVTEAAGKVAEQITAERAAVAAKALAVAAIGYGAYRMGIGSGFESLMASNPSLSAEKAKELAEFGSGANAMMTMLVSGIAITHDFLGEPISKGISAIGGKLKGAYHSVSETLGGSHESAAEDDDTDATVEKFISDLEKAA